MRSLVFVVLAAVSTVPALAQDQSIRVTGAQQGYQLQPPEVAEMVGVYKLDNGGVFRMSRTGRHLMAQLGERAVTELVAQDATHFIARDQRMTVDYLPQAFGDLITLTYPADLARLDAPMVSVTFAAN
ncbi:hypothetical protein [Massilia sp. PWRC2]|uniref:hypothetical protein n=1 Tax=Massilia sp. PWRC2 TaxID=2804626 RepID=UPI003CF56420